MIPVTGDHVGPYEILGRLGSGGMGLVFSAWDARLHRDVAIKMLREDLLNDDSRERFLMEARTASSLNHPNICTVFDMGEEDGTPYLVMELLKGETLRSAITRGKMSRREIFAVGCAVADALVSAHARGIIHRDIKPANIFLVSKPHGGWQPKVLDFGLAKMDLSEHLDPRYEMTVQGATVGTVAYMSPEQARGEPLDARSDLFELGIVLYEMATRMLPFLGATTALVFDSLLNETPVPIRERNPDCPVELEYLILRLLEKRPEDRYQSAAELLNALHNLRDLLEGRPSGMIEEVAPAAVPQPVRESSGRMPAALEKVSSRQRISAVRPPERSSGVAPPAAATSSGSSSEEIVIRPIKREALPPTEIPLSPKHWTQPRTFGPGGPSSGRIPRAAMAPLTIEEPLPAEEQPAEPEVHWAKRWMPTLILLAAAVSFVGFVVWKTQTEPPAPSGPAQLFLAGVVNRSGDNALDGVVLGGLRFDLAQSQAIVLSGVQGPGAVEITTVDEALKAGKAVGATYVLFGEVRRGGGPYTVDVKVYNVNSGASVMQAEENAVSREELGNTIDRIAEETRVGLGEPGDDVRRRTVSLRRDASANVEALQAYVTGQASASAGKTADAVASMQHAVLLDANFTQAWIVLARLYDGEHAELAAIDAATHARDSDADTSDRTKLLAEICFALRGEGDLTHAQTLLDQFAAQYPQDQATGAVRAEVLRRQGRFAEAIVAAQNTLAKNSFDIHAALQAELAMIALDRTDAAAEMERQSERKGQRHGGIGVLLSYWSGQDVPSTNADDLRTRMSRAEVLDATGQLSAGAAAWEAVAATAKQTAATVSSASYALAKGGLDQALAGACSTAVPMAHEATVLPHGPEAAFAAGAALGLCGDGGAVRSAMNTLTVNYAGRSAVKNYLLTDLIGIDAMRTGDWQSAVSALEGARSYDLVSLTPYLRGLAEMGGKQWTAAIGDLQMVLLHRGSITLVAATAYPMTQLSVARAYVASGDRTSGAAGYRSFRELWKMADPALPVMVEAQRNQR